MTRYIDISLDKRGVTCVARLLDDLAPRTCDAVWNALPLGSDVYHAKYARKKYGRSAQSGRMMSPIESSLRPRWLNSILRDLSRNTSCSAFHAGAAFISTAVVAYYPCANRKYPYLQFW